MKKLIGLLIAVIMVMPFAMASETGSGIGIDITVEEFEPRVWMCDNRVVIDDDLQPGRFDGREVYSEKIETCECVFDTCMTLCGQGQLSGSFDCSGIECPYEFDAQLNWPQECYTACVELTYKYDCDILKGYELFERMENYAFEGEKVEWLVLVMDKNKIEQIEEVVVTLGSSQGTGNDVEVECVELHGFAAPGSQLMPECNARIDEEELDQFDDQVMAYYECTLTVETPWSMEGEFWVTIEALDTTGLSATVDENEYWFFNPVLALSVDGDLTFSDVRPGTVSYSETLLVGNDAEAGSGVMLDMFVSGTDFYDPSSSGARCVITNRLKLGNNYAAAGLMGFGATEWWESSQNECDIGFGDTDDHLCYYATSGAYGTQTDPRSDVEGYAPIVYGDAWTRDFYNDAEIIMNPLWGGLYSPGNLLSPGAEIAMTFKLGLPLPCVGDFSDGMIYFWGEAV